MVKTKVLDNKKSSRNGSKALVRKIILMVVFLLVASSPIFAADSQVGSEVNNIVGSIVNFFASGWVKGLACIALIAEAIALIFAGGQNPQIFKKFLPLIAGTVIFMCAGKIISLVFSANSEQDFKSDLEKKVSLKSLEIDQSDYEALGFVFTDDLA